MTRFSVLPAVSASLTLLATPALADEASKGEARLAQMLEGRVAGEPERCVRLLGGDSLTIIDGTAVVAKRGDTVWVNRTANPALLNERAEMEIRKVGSSRLCQSDEIHRVRRIHSFPNSQVTYSTATVVLEEFVPYRSAG